MVDNVKYNTRGLDSGCYCLVTYDRMKTRCQRGERDEKVNIMPDDCNVGSFFGRLWGFCYF